VGTNTIFRGVWRAENLKLYFHRKSALGLFTGVLGKNGGKGKGGAEYNLYFTNTLCSLRLTFWNKALRNFLHGGFINLILTLNKEYYPRADLVGFSPLALNA